MKKFFTILVCLLPLCVSAQIVQPVTWSGEQVGDSVRLKAAIEPGWHMNIIEFGDGIYGCEAASQHYFGHSAKTLSRREAAQLAATLPSPLKRNPSHSSPYFRRRTADIQSRFSWGKVDLDNPDPKKQKKYKDQEGIVDFMKWYFNKEK